MKLYQLFPILSIAIPYPLELCQKVMRRRIGTEDSFCQDRCKLAWEDPDYYGCPVDPESDGLDFLECFREVHWMQCIDRRVRGYDVRGHFPLANELFAKEGSIDVANKHLPLEYNIAKMMNDPLRVAEIREQARRIEREQSQ